MKCLFIVVFVLFVVFMSVGVFVVDEDMGELKINGEVVGIFCIFEGVNSVIIELFQVGVDRLIDLNSGDIYIGYISLEVILKVKCLNIVNL